MGYAIDWFVAHEAAVGVVVAAICLWLKWQAHRSGAFK